MAVTVRKKFWGLDCIIRHDYEDVVLQNKLKDLQQKSFDSFRHFTTNGEAVKRKSYSCIDRIVYCSWISQSRSDGYSAYIFCTIIAK
jgi:hypothetical protein